ncbi:polyprenyl synthetase family protein [Jonesia quinghaiensis]|uniref:polyprenyl synthetase family protein n=1 Tax=Jonesia quinghaiensis TaxID=262806 RepID=UPI00146A90B5|nr:polyprenyl synthetase family protein [Jonesia quinghaiensis]
MSSSALATLAEFQTQLTQMHGRGRRVRPQLFLDAYRSFTRPQHVGLTTASSESTTSRLVTLPNNHEAQAVAEAIEQLHTAFLIHDDVIDHDTMRRGQTNLNGHFQLLAQASDVDLPSARAFGDSAGILGGVLALTESLMGIATLDLPQRQRQQLLAAFNEAITLSALGELLDVYYATHPHFISIPDTLKVAELKTAEYSFVLPLRAASILAGQEETTTEALVAIGRHIGIAYQFQDDLNGVFAPTSVTGKEVGADLREKKDTLLIAFARTTDVWPEIERLLGPTITQLGVMRVQELLLECGAARFVENHIRDHVCIAMNLATEHNIATSDIPVLTTLLDGLTS